jgi:hypothetical protein
VEVADVVSPHVRADAGAAASVGAPPTTAAACRPDPVPGETYPAGSVGWVVGGGAGARNGVVDVGIPGVEVDAGAAAVCTVAATALTLGTTAKAAAHAATTAPRK